jgi:hypothetical protein
VKEFRFSIQCGASNRKSLITRRCSQCTLEQGDHEANALTSEPAPPSSDFRHRSISNRSASSASANCSTTRPKTTTERGSDSEKFDTLLMLAAERNSHQDKRARPSLRRQDSTTSQLKMSSLMVMEQPRINQGSSYRSNHLRSPANAFKRSATANNSSFHDDMFVPDSSARSSSQSPQYGDDDADLNGADISSGSTSSTNPRLPLRISRL